ncbi:MAG TPA: sugar phosphate isomerase/epimerase [Sedimentisphaerales bacterium]|nr:sugar phosphate isomerase/epimerase [Sedimentisphaerales bacterium]
MSALNTESVSRRGFMAQSVAAAALLTSGAFGAEKNKKKQQPTKQAKRQVPIGLQLYSVREDCKRDLPGTIAAVGKMGYDGVEFAGYYDRSAEELRKMLDDNGLVCCGTHTQVDTLLEDNLAKTIEFNKTLGNKYLIVPGLPEKYRSSHQAWLDSAKLFNELAEKVKPDGMLVGYHNHGVEFAAMDGELPWETFFGNTSKDVIMQLDVGNAMHGGADPLPYLYRYPERAITVHVKEYSKTDENAFVGEGDVNWKAFFALCKAVGNTEWYIVEYERPGTPPLEAVKRCLQNLRKMKLL